MSQTESVKEVEALHALYNQHSQELEGALNEAKSGGLTTELMKKITALNTRCEELMHEYLTAFEAYYGHSHK